MEGRAYRAFLCLGVFCSATAQSYKTGTNVISAGLGLGSNIAGYSYGTQSPGFSIQYERGLWEAGPGVISLGGYFGIKGYKYSDVDYTEKWTYSIFGVRGAYHYTGLDVENLDLYGGLLLSYNHLSYSTNYSGSDLSGSWGSSLYLTPFVGARYYFMPALSAFAELGYGVSILSIGLALRF